VAITNFTWDVIYRAYADAHPGFAPLIDQIANCYSQATLLLALPYPCQMNAFPRREPIPWITRASELSKQAARAQFELPRDATIALLSFGGLGLSRLPWGKLNQTRELFFVGTGDARTQDGNILILPDTQRHYEDLVQAVDVMITKPGYGIVADILAHKVPILYTDRGEFPEYPRLVQALAECATAKYIPQRQLLAGNLAPPITRLLDKEPHWPDVPLDGAEVAAQKLLDLLD
jgi:hypothetical protein